jgi:Bacterial Ig-like domain
MRKQAYFFFFLLILASCAQILSPSGGEKDLQAPFVVEYEPDSAATNFNSKRIIIRFNEFVQLNDLKNQLVVSPQMNEDPEINIRKKEIVIDLPDSLAPNTTYTISFGTAIKDITESNVLDNFRYVFSTGPAIDSLKLEGKLQNALTLAPEKGVLVMLYNTLEDSAPLKRKPYYFTKTRADGSFRITNMKAGTYKLFALDDKNQNYRYDNLEERIAFADQPIVLNTNIDSVSLRLFREIPSRQSRTNFNQFYANHILFMYARPVQDAQVVYKSELPPNVNVFVEKGINGDSIHLWFSEVPMDSLRYLLRDGKQPVDSMSIRFSRSTKKQEGRGGDSDLKKIKLSSNVNGSMFDLGKKLVVSSNNPIRDFNGTDFVLYQGRTLVTPLVSLSENKHQLIFENTLLEDSSYVLLIKPGQITDWMGQKNDTLKLKFKVESSRSYGTAKVSLKNLNAGNFVLQLLDEKGANVRQTHVQAGLPITFEYLRAGTYSLKLIVDENANDKWDSGNYLEKKQPEKVIYYGQPVKVRAGWDLDIEWIFE